MSKEAKNTLKTILTYAVLILMALVMLVPFAWMISASLKLEKDVFSYPIVWIPRIRYGATIRRSGRRCHCCRAFLTRQS